MSIQHYIDNEVPAFGEWDSVRDDDASTIVQTTLASFPERGSIGLRCDDVGGSAVYVTKTGMGIPIAAGDSLYVGFWMHANVLPGATSLILYLFNATPTSVAYMYLYSDGRLLWRTKNDAGGVVGTPTYTIVAGRWYYVVVRSRRATSDVAGDGYGVLYVDGRLIGQSANTDNYDILANLDELQLGHIAGATGGSNVDFDEVKVASDYPEPYRPYQQGAVLSGLQSAVVPAVVGGYLRLRK